MQKAVRTTSSHHKKGDTDLVSLFLFVVPEARIELARTQGPLDFESSASTNFTTPAKFIAALNGVLGLAEPSSVKCPERL